MFLNSLQISKFLPIRYLKILVSSGHHDNLLYVHRSGDTTIMVGTGLFLRIPKHLLSIQRLFKIFSEFQNGINMGGRILDKIEKGL